MAFLHLPLGRQKATSGSFSTDGFGWLGLNPAGVSLFRMHVERRLSGLLRPIQARPKLLFHGRPLPGFPWLFNNFAAACQLMSFQFDAACQVICQAVALAFLHLSLGRQKATSGTFSMDGFGGLGLNPAGVPCFGCRMHVERCPSEPQNFDFDAACQVMSGSYVGLSSSFFL